MKIEYLRLENFVNVYAGLKRKKVELDFTKGSNKKILLLGDNGSGKTVLLSSLQPYRETNDNREMSLLEDETRATKEIHIRDGENLYEIIHYYGKSSSQNKSYIKKNGEELNEGGSIRNFLTILEGELHITKDYFVLGRLGDNVSNFIDQGMSDRKKYINKFIPDIDRYLVAHKLVSDRLNSLDKQIKTINVSLERYGNLDENEAERAKLEARLETLIYLKENLTATVTVLELRQTDAQQKLKALPENLVENLELLTAEIEEDKATIQQIQGIKNEEDKFSLAFTNKFLDKLHEKLRTVEQDQSAKSSQRAELQTAIQTAQDQISRNLSTIEMMGDDSAEALENRSQELKSLIESAEKDIQELELDKTLTTFMASNSNIDYGAIRSHLANFSYTLSNLISSAPASVTEYLLPNVWKKDVFQTIEEDLQTVIATGVKLTRDYEELRTEYDKLNRKSGLLEVLDHSEHSDHAKDCPIVALAIGFQKEGLTINDLGDQLKLTNSQILEAQAQKAKLEETLSDLSSFLRSYQDTLNSFYSKEKTAFDQLFPKRLTEYPTDKLEAYLRTLDGLLKNAQMYVDKQTELEGLKEKLQAVKKAMANLEVIDHLYKENTRQKELVVTRTAELEEIETVLSSLRRTDNVYRTAIRQLTVNRDLLTTLPAKEAAAAELQSHLDEVLTLETQLRDLDTDLAKVRPNLVAATTEISQVQTDLETLKKAYYLITDSVDRLNKIHAVRSTYKLVQDALDPKKGIPLIFSENYLTSISEKANELLDVAYKGTYQLKFALDKRDFRIEILKGDGNNLSDISLASQGETAMTSISLSLSMLGQIMKAQGGFNVIYLDEMDAELDASNRKSFINVLDRQIELLDVEQVFIITHNNEFHTSDVDLVLLNGYETKIDITDKSVMEGKSIIYKNY